MQKAENPFRFLAKQKALPQWEGRKALGELTPRQRIPLRHPHPRRHHPSWAYRKCR